MHNPHLTKPFCHKHMVYLSKHNQFSPLKLKIIDLKLTQHLQGLPVTILEPGLQI